MQDAKQDASGCSSGPGSQLSEHERPLSGLIAALFAQAEAINRLAASNEALVQAMAEAEGVEPEDVPAKVGLNGRQL